MIERSLSHDLGAAAGIDYRPVGLLDRALSLADNLPIDLALVDVNLNGVSSFPLAAALAARKIPFVFATGYGTAAIERRWSGVPTLQKPFQTSDLAAAMSRALN